MSRFATLAVLSGLVLLGGVARSQDLPVARALEHPVPRGGLPDASEIEVAVERACTWLVAHQAADGRWSDGATRLPVSREELRDLERGATALAVSALLPTSRSDPVERGLVALTRGAVAHPSGVVGDALALDALVAALGDARWAGRRDLTEALHATVARLVARQQVNGSWEGGASWPSSTATTALVLAALGRAREARVPVSPTAIERARGVLESSAGAPGTWSATAGGPPGPRARLTSVAREGLVLDALGTGPGHDAGERAGALARLVQDHALLDAVRGRPAPGLLGLDGRVVPLAHERAARLLAGLTRAERARFSGLLAREVLAGLTGDGAARGVPLLEGHRTMATGLAVLALRRCEG